VQHQAAPAVWFDDAARSRIIRAARGRRDRDDFVALERRLSLNDEASMRVTLVRSALLVAGGIMSGTVAMAQAGRSYIGPHLAYHFDIEEPAIGAQVGIPLSYVLDVYPSFDYYLVDSGSLWALNIDLKFRGSSGIYVGGGLNVTDRDLPNGVERSDKGLNLLAGFESRSGQVNPYFEGRVTVDDGSTFQVAVGLNFLLR
jgi:hypothetical protein